MGGIGFVLTALWIKLIHNPTDYPRMSAEELKFISENGAVVDMDHKKPGSAAASGPKLHYIKQLLSNRMMLAYFSDNILSTPSPGSSSPGSRFIWCRKKACRF